MMDEYAIFPNIVDETVPASDLKLANAKMFAEALSSSGHSKLISCHIIISNQVPFFFKGTEFIIYDADIDVGQWPLNDIRYVERIAILFFANDNYTPLVFALRNSFPEVLHRVSMPFERPACLCIYDQSWGHQKLSWRPIKLMEDIRNWLSKTADGTLHPDDQPLEPLLLHVQGQIILPFKFNLANRFMLGLLANIGT